MRVRLLESGESYDLGVYARGDIRVLNDKTANLYISRKLAEEVKPEKAAPVTAGKKEVKDDGGE